LFAISLVSIFLSTLSLVLFVLSITDLVLLADQGSRGDAMVVRHPSQVRGRVAG
jgi:hypothetical protein